MHKQVFVDYKDQCLVENWNMQVVAAGANPVLITRGIEKTSKALVAELKKMSKEVSSQYSSQILLVIALSLCALKDCSFFGLQVEDSELADVAAVSAGNNYEVGNMITEAMATIIVIFRLELTLLRKH